MHICDSWVLIFNERATSRVEKFIGDWLDVGGCNLEKVGQAHKFKTLMLDLAMIFLVLTNN